MPGTSSRETHTQLRRAAPGDGADILAIYNQSIQRGEIARHCHELTMAELASALRPDDDRYPTYVTAADGVVRGWAGFRPWHDRAAYSFTVELLVYVAPTDRGRGLGKALVEHTIESAACAGYHSIVALCAEDDAVAGHLLRCAGFCISGWPRALFPEFERMHDVRMYQRTLLWDARR